MDKGLQPLGCSLSCKIWQCAVCKSVYIQPCASQDYEAAGADQLTFHIEAVVGEPVAVNGQKDPDVMEVIQEIKEAGMYVGVALKPATPAEALLPYLEDIDMVRPASEALPSLGAHT